MIKQAIIPLAGLGTRMLPLTSIFPKELLPINGKPNLEYIMDECIEAGVKDLFLSFLLKKSIKKYFFNDNFYKKILKKKKDKRISYEFKKIKKYRKMIKFVYQNKPRGTGDAVLKCEKFINSKYFLIFLPDDLIIKKNCSKEMIKLYNKKKCSVIATKRVNQNTVSRWGILSLKNKKNNSFQITNVIEKPKIKEAPSNYAIIGRYILPRKIMKEIKKLRPGQNEIHVTDAIKNLIYKGEIFMAIFLKENI